MTVKAFVIDAGAGDDVITGTAGNDVIQGGSGNDVLNGGGGNDTFLLQGGSGGSTSADGLDQYDGGSGVNTIEAYAYGSSTLLVNNNLANLKNIQVIDGGNDPWRSNRIMATAGNDTLDFSAMTVKAFVIDAGAGDDVITGTAGNDVIQGGSGNDAITGGKGQDALYGGDGNDAYYWQIGDGADEITDSVGSNQIFIGGVTSASDVSVTVSSTRYTLNIATATGAETLALMRDQNESNGSFVVNVAGQSFTLEPGTGKLKPMDATSGIQIASMSKATAAPATPGSVADSTLVSPWIALDAGLRMLPPMDQMATNTLPNEASSSTPFIAVSAAQQRWVSSPSAGTSL